MLLPLSSHAGSRWRRMLVVLVAIPTVIVSLLAMHLLLSESPTPDTHAAIASISLSGSAVTESSLVAVIQGDATAQEDCAETCSPPHDELMMACVLALLGSALLLLFHSLRFQLRARTAALQLAYHHVFAPVSAHRPSLHMLSISRT
ncbi:MAG: hypothetical protein ACOH14_02560 [Rhodoglobus sp.]